MIKPSKIGVYPMNNAPDNTSLIVAYDGRNKVLAEFEVKKDIPYVTQALKNKVKADNSSDDFWRSWNSYSKKNRA